MVSKILNRRGTLAIKNFKQAIIDIFLRYTMKFLKIYMHSFEIECKLMFLHVRFFGVEVKAHSSSVSGNKRLPFLLFLPTHSCWCPL